MSTIHDTHGVSDLGRAYACTFKPFDGAFNATSLLREAESATGLGDWGGQGMAEPGFRRRLDLLCASLDQEAQLTSLGRTRAHGRLLAMLISRLRTVDYVRRAPELPAITAPLIGTGLPRAGTSFLQALLAQDPDNLVPITAHGLVPIPPPGVLEDEAARMALADEMIAFQGLKSPEVNAIHPMAPDAEDEDVLFQEAACGSLYQGFFNVPGFVGELQADFGELYDWQKQLMQVVQAGRSGKRWVLKAPEYLGRIDDVLARYPDGMVFVNHRDPAKVIGSIASLYMTFQSLNSTGAVPPEYLGPPMMEAQRRALDSFEAWREAHPGVLVVDVHYRDLVDDPIAQAERLYSAFGLPMTASARQSMTEFLAVNRHGQASHGVKHSYELTDFGVTEAMIEDCFGPYIDRYRIERELGR